ncbi:MAG: GvpL/GvpF family gas vesicle protein [Nocardioidaceae bacterium]|nr:GvpL/GvpF family gas vesicle protein [Nocardioidaceae bacterium]
MSAEHEPSLRDDASAVVHAYGVVLGGEPVPLPVTGIAGAGVALLDAGSVAAVFSRLPGCSYGESAWREHAEDPRWLAEVAVQHQRVLDEIVEDSDVLPLRLPAMFRDEEHLHRVLAGRAALLEAALVATHDHVEWGVQLLAAEQPAAPPQEERPSSGREFFEQRARRSSALARARSRRDALVREAYAALADVSRQSVLNNPQDPALSGRSETMLLNSAHLVGRRHRDFFMTTVEEVAERLRPAGISVEVSGPWPPYNFVALGTEELVGDDDG